jgi:hypothetical protein
MSDHARNQKGRQDTDNSTASEKGESDEDKDNRKQSARTSPTIESNRQQNQVDHTTQSPAELQAVLIKTEGQLVRAQRQVGAIS